MSIYTIATTNSLKSSVPELANATAGDVIVTSGYYAANDGGAGTFDIRARVAGDTVDNMFTYALGTDLIAELQTPDGVVNVDQLGAKELLGSYQTYEEYLGENPSSLSQVSAYSDALCQDMVQQQLNGEDDLFENGRIIATALNDGAIHTIRFSPGKTYGVGHKDQNQAITASIVIERSDVTLDGCGASIRAYYPERQGIICINKSENPSHLNSICIQNLHLYGLWRPTPSGSSSYVHGIRVRWTDNLTIRNVQIENVGYGIRIADTYSNLTLEHLRIEKALTGIQLSGHANGGHLTDSYISCDWNLLNQNGGGGNHGIYLSGQIQHFQFMRLEILNTGLGNAVTRHNGANTSPICENLVFSDIRIENCDVGLFLGERTHNVLVQRVYAKAFSNAGVHFSGVDQILLKDSLFESTKDKGKGFSTSASDTANAYVKHVVVKRCGFKTHHCFFSIGTNTNAHAELSDDSMTFEDCEFSVQTAEISDTKKVAPIAGAIEKLIFRQCVFSIEQFTSSQSSTGLFFHFQSPSDMHCMFDSCRFLNNGTMVVNSPIMIHNASNSILTTEAKHNFIAVRNCIVKGFRWLIRYASITVEGEAIQYIDPACIGYPSSSDTANAINDLNNTNRVLSFGNFYMDEIAGNSYKSFRKAEEYGF